MILWQFLVGRVFKDNLDAMWEFAKEFLRAAGPSQMEYGCDQLTMRGDVVPKYSLPSAGTVPSAGTGVAAEVLMRFVGGLDDHRSVEEVMAASADDFRDPRYMCSLPPCFS